LVFYIWTHHEALTQAWSASVMTDIAQAEADLETIHILSNEMQALLEVARSPWLSLFDIIGLERGTTLLPNRAFTLPLRSELISVKFCH
jgi:hypothetical protein